MMMIMAVWMMLAAWPPGANSTGGSAMEKAVFGGGCFWCTEAVFREVEGVTDVVVGYSGGTRPNPTYEQVCTGATGHAEVAEITFDPQKVSYGKLLDIFWKTHDPTSMNRQGADEGTQYRSVIFYTSDAQKLAAEKSKAEVQKQFTKPVVTAIEPLKNFYRAEEYHQNYFKKNPNAPYCVFVIRPKLHKVQ